MSRSRSATAQGPETRQGGPDGHVGDFSTLAVSWREEAQRLRTLEAHGQAAALEQAASQLDARIAAWALEPLTIREAAAESGYSEEHLRRLAREGQLPVQPNGGPKSRIQVRRGDLPIKRRGDGRGKPKGVSYDPVEDARDIAQLLEAKR